MPIQFKLKKLIAMQETTQTKLSIVTGIRLPTISAICNDSIKHIPVDVLEKLCTALNCQPGDIMECVSESTSTIPSGLTTITESTPWPEPNPAAKEAAPIRPFTPEAKQAIDLNRLLQDIRYQIDLSTVYGPAAISELITEARRTAKAAPSEITMLCNQVLERKPAGLDEPAAATTSPPVNAPAPESTSTPEFTESISPNGVVIIHRKETLDQKLERLSSEFCTPNEERIS